MATFLKEVDANHWLWFSIFCICTFFFMFPLWSKNRHYKTLVFQETRRLELLHEDNEVLMSRANKLENTIRDVEDLLKERLKRLKEENYRLQTECERLEAFLLDSEKRLSTPAKSEDEVEEFTKVSESLQRSQEEMNQMITERDSLLEQLDIAKKQRDEVINEYNTLCQKRFMYGRNTSCAPINKDYLL